MRTTTLNRTTALNIIGVTLIALALGIGALLGKIITPDNPAHAYTPERGNGCGLTCIATNGSGGNIPNPLTGTGGGGNQPHTGTGGSDGNLR